MLYQYVPHAREERERERIAFLVGLKKSGLSGGVAPTLITATVRIIREVSATAVKALPVRP